MIFVQMRSVSHLMFKKDSYLLTYSLVEQHNLTKKIIMKAKRACGVMTRRKCMPAAVESAIVNVSFNVTFFRE